MLGAALGCPCTPLQLCDVSAAGSRLREEELRENLEQEEARLEQMRAQMSRNQKRLIEFENIIDNLFLRLQGVFIPGQVPQGAGGARPGRRGSAGTPGTATTRGSLSPPPWFLLPQDDSVAVVGLEEKLQHCEQKMQFLKEKVAARPEDSTDERSEVRGLRPSVPLGTHAGPSQMATQAIHPQQGRREGPWNSSAPEGTGHPRGTQGCNTPLPSST